MRVQRSDDKSLGDLVKELAEEGSNLVHAEVRIAEAKLSQRIRMAVKPIVVFAAAGIFGFIALLMLFLTFAAWLATTLSWAMALTIVMAVALAIAIGLFFYARRDLSLVFKGTPTTASDREAIE